MTGTSQYIKPHPDIRAGDAQRTFVLVRHGHHLDDKRVKFALSQPPNPRKFSRAETPLGLVERFSICPRSDAESFEDRITIVLTSCGARDRPPASALASCDNLADRPQARQWPTG
jgi:hypothetical protein